MKTCYIISGFYMDGPPKEDGTPDRIPVLAGETVDLPDDLADQYDRTGTLDIISHDGVPVVWGGCCGGHD